MNFNEGIQTSDLVGIARRRAPAAAAVAGACFLASIVVAAILPNRYEAWTTMLVSPQTISKRLVETGVEESDLNNRLHLMTMQILSRSRLSKIIDEFGLYPDESKEMTREQVIEMMRGDIRVEAVLPELEGGRRQGQEFEINTFQLFYKSHRAQTAADVANRLANDFIEEHLRERVSVSSSTSEFIEAERARLATEIREVEERIAAVKNENTGRLPEDLEANYRLLERAVTDLRFAQRDLAIAESDAAFYRQQVASGGAERFRGAEPDTPRERQRHLQIALGEARARGLTEKHPDIVAIHEELASLERRIAEAVPGSEGELSPEQALAANEAQRAALRAESARAEVARLNAQIDEIQTRIAQTPQVVEQLTALERVHQHLYQSFQDFSNKQLEAGVAANMERRQKGEQVRILEAAFPPPVASSPNRVAIVLIGLMLGLAAGGGVALLLEVSDTSLHGAREVQATFSVPVLATIPRVMLEFDRARQRRKRILAGALSAALALVTLFGAGAGYWMVNRAPVGEDASAGSPPAAAPQPRG